MVNVNRMSLTGTGMGPTTLSGRVCDRVRRDDGWNLTLSFMSRRAPAKAIVRVVTNGDVHIGDSVAVRGVPYVGVDGMLHIDADGEGRIAHTHGDGIPAKRGWEAL